MEAARHEGSMSDRVEMPSGASSVQVLNRTVSPGASMPQFTTLPSLPTAPQPTLSLFWEQSPRPVMSVGSSPGNPLVLSPLIGLSMVPGHGTFRPGAPAPLNNTNVGTIERPPQPLQNANIFLTQLPINVSTAGALIGGVEQTGALHFKAPGVNTVTTLPAAVPTHVSQGTWVLSFNSPAPPPVLQMVPIVSPVNMASQPQGAHEEHGLGNSQVNIPPNKSHQPASVYENFRHWQKIKALVRNHLPQMTDVEAFSCFLIPVLRTLARQKPNMNLQEGLWRGVQEWKCTNTSERTNYQEMANKFLEFEVEEEVSRKRMKNMGGSECQTLPAPPRQEPPRPVAAEVIKEPVHISVKSGPEKHPAHLLGTKCKRSPETKILMEILPKSIHEPMKNTDWLQECSLSKMGEKEEKVKMNSTETQQEDHMLYPDPGLLRYLDELCSQKNFISKVEAIINPRFLDQILSPEADIDILALTKELELEEGLTPDQLVEKRLQSSNKKRRVLLPWNAGATQVAPRTEKDECSPCQELQKRRCASLGLQRRRKKRH